MPVIAVAAMQQVEAGKISLDADISRYVDLPLAKRIGGPITVRELLTHTAGFADKMPIVSSSDLRSYLALNMPARVYPAGALNSFSPYGMALAAYIVERAAGESFAEYVRDRIFVPLGMTCTTMLQPAPTTLRCAPSQGYGPSTEPPLPPETLAVALSLSTSAADMGNFGAMLLDHGTLRGQRILSPKSVATILSRQSAVSKDLSPNIPGMGLAFHEIWFNRASFFGQSGDTKAFHSEFDIDPQRKLVLFITYNSSGHPGNSGEPSKLATFARGELIHGIFDRYQPFHPTVIHAAPTAGQRRLATGTWIPADEVELPFNPLHLIHSSIAPVGDALLVDRFLSDRGTVKHWSMLLPDLWQQYPQDLIEAIPGRGGLPDRLALASNPANQLVRVSTRTHEDKSIAIPRRVVHRLGQQE